MASDPSQSGSRGLDPQRQSVARKAVLAAGDHERRMHGVGLHIEEPLPAGVQTGAPPPANSFTVACADFGIEAGILPHRAFEPSIPCSTSHSDLRGGALKSTGLHPQFIPASDATRPMPSRTYTTERSTGFYEITRALVGAEVKAGNTICFLYEIDLTELEKYRRSVTAPVRPSYTAILAKTLSIALREFPYANARFYNWFGIPFTWRVQRFKTVDVAIAVEREVEGYPNATFIDVVRDVERKDVPELASGIRALADATVENNPQWRDYFKLVTKVPAPISLLLLRLPVWLPGAWVKYRGGASLISSPSKYGVETLVGWWPYPIGVTFGLAKPSVKVKDGVVTVVPTLRFALNWDRRLMAGAQAARFFARMVELLETGAFASYALPPAVEVAPEPAPLPLWARCLESLFGVGKRAASKQ